MTNVENQEYSSIACLFNLLSFLYFAQREIEAKPNFLFCEMEGARDLS